MKRFRYNLETVLNYKNQELDNLKIQHASALERVSKKKEEIHCMEGALSQIQSGLDRTVQNGAPIETLRLYDRCIDGARKQIEQKKEQLLQLKKDEKEKREEVLTARVDTSRYEKLREHRLEDYRKAVKKEEEIFVEEFIIRGMSIGGERGDDA